MLSCSLLFCSSGIYKLIDLKEAEFVSKYIYVFFNQLLSEVKSLLCFQTTVRKPKKNEQLGGWLVSGVTHTNKAFINKEPRAVSVTADCNDSKGERHVLRRMRSISQPDVGSSRPENGSTARYCPWATLQVNPMPWPLTNVFFNFILPVGFKGRQRLGVG